MNKFAHPAESSSILVLDAAALIAWFKADKGLNANAIAMHLGALHAQRGIRIPDQVFFEMTGLLPNNLEHIKQTLRDTSEDAQRQAIQDLAASLPVAGGNRKAEIEGLLSFMAQHPDAIVQTDIGTHYGHYAYCGGNIDQLTDAQPLNRHYTLTKGNVQYLLKQHFSGDEARVKAHFDIEKLRVHVGDLVQMGWMHRDEFKKRTERPQTSRSLKKNFETVTNFIKLLEQEYEIEALKKGEGKYKEMSEKERNLLLKEREELLENITEQLEGYRPNGVTAGNKFYLTFGMLNGVTRKVFDKESHKYKTIKPLLPEYQKPRHSFGEEATKRHTIEEITAPTELLMEHAFFSADIEDEKFGLLPLNKLSEIAGLFGFEAGDWRDKTYRDTLEKVGFFERRITLNDVQRIGANFVGDAAFDAWRLLDNPAQIAARRREALKNNVRNRSEKRRNTLAFDPKKGAAYEYALVDALRYDQITWDEFVNIALASDALQAESEHPAAIGKSGSIWVSKDRQTLYVAEQGVECRHGNVILNRPDARDAVIQHVGYKCYEVKEFLEEAKSNKDMRHTLRAMIYPTVEQDAAAFRTKVADILDAGMQPPASRLMQIEHNWMRKHKAYWGGKNSEDALRHKKGHNMPYFTSLFASLHEQRSNARNSLGEIACCEVALALAEQDKAATIVTHDNAIQMNREADRISERFTFSAAIKRQHAELGESIKTLETDIARQSVNKINTQKSDDFAKEMSQPDKYIMPAGRPDKKPPTSARLYG